MARKNPIPETSPAIEMWGLNKYGIIQDTKPHLIPPQAYTNGRNVRFTANGVERFLGHEQVFGTLLGTPYQILNVPTVGLNFWIYMDLDKIFGFDGVSHADLSRTVGGAYSATEGFQWQSTILGGIPILNNGIDVPQYWTGFSLTDPFENLSDWPSTLRAKVVKAFGSYLIAFNLTDNGTPLPKAIQWSSLADPGSIPASWDITDPTVDAGRRQLTDDKGGEIVDALLLGNQGIIYTDYATHVARYVGGIDIFTTDLLLKESGLLARGCVCAFKKGVSHFVVSQDDVLIHAGTKEAESIIENKNRKFIFNELDPDSLRYSFAFENAREKEVWFCFPMLGSEYPNLAFIWNYRDNTQTFREIDFNSADVGSIFDPAATTWASSSDLWETAGGPWNSSARNRVVVSSVNEEKAYQLDKEGAYGDVTPTSFIERTGLAIDGVDKDGQPKGSIQTQKLLKRLWPKITGTEVVTITTGSQEKLDGPITWQASQTFNPAVDKYIDVYCEGTLLAYRIEHTGNATWYLEGVDFEIEVLARL